MKLLNNRWITCLMAILFIILDIFILLSYSNNSVIILSLIILFNIILFYNVIIELYVALIFMPPGRRKSSIDNPNWTHNRLKHDGPEIYFLSKIKNEKAPLMVMVHGWRSSSKSLEQRANLYLELGYHVIIMELPGHGNAESVSKWNAGISTQNLLFLMDNLESYIDAKLISKIYFHGHSIGGFILIKFSKEFTNSKSNELIEGYILESPMTCYSEIYNEFCDKMLVPRLFRSLLWKRLSFHFNSLNLNFDKIKDLQDVDVPQWGVPDVNTLVVQAENDKTLGMGHYNRLVESFKQSNKSHLLTNIVIKGLTHSGARENEDRDLVISNWLEDL